MRSKNVRKNSITTEVKNKKQEKERHTRTQRTSTEGKRRQCEIKRSPKDKCV
jgi:hypothetical protein